MIIFLDCIQDAFITNKVIDNSFRATDANTGRGGSLELFKFYDENVLPGTSSGVIENSRLLVRFDFNTIRALTGTNGILSGTKLKGAKFKLHMFDLIHNDTIPSDFNIVIFPLSRSWVEGQGIDVNYFQDIGVCNWLTASGMTDTWYISGAMSGGYVGQSNIDYVTASSAIGDLYKTFNFPDGTEDLLVDISTICSASVTNQIPDYGFIIAFSGTEETDIYTRYKKAFYTRHTDQKEFAPRIEVYWDDSLRDNQSNFVFDYTGSLFFYNVVRGAISTVTSASVNQSTLSVELTAHSASSGSSTVYTNAMTANEIFTGIYSCSFAVDSTQTALTGQINTNGSASFHVYWKNNAKTKAYRTGSLEIFEPTRSSYVKPKKYIVSITNLKSEYFADEIERLRVFVQEVNFSTDSSKLPSESESLLIDKIYYQVRNVNSNEILVAFDDTSDSTRLSYDEQGMYFDFHTSVCRPVGEIFQLEFMVNVDGAKQYIRDVFKFKMIE